MSEPERRIRVLYLVYWGALEPLGRALVVPVVQRLAALGVDLTLMTFEKAADLAETGEVERLRTRFESAGVRWNPLRYHKTPKWPATAFDGCVAVLSAIKLRMSGPFDIVHARTFVAGPIGLAIAHLLGARLVYQNEGFYPDEQVDAGVWKVASAQYRVATKLETILYRQADGVLALSSQSIPEIRVRRGRADGLAISPSAIDLESIEARTLPPAWNGVKPLRLCYLGSLGGRYQTEDLMMFVATLAKRLPVHLLVLTRSGPELIGMAAARAGVPAPLYEVRSAAHDDVPALLATRQVGLHFLPRTKGTSGGSPTKVGEYWASGLPVVISSGMGDLDDIVEAERVGVVVEDNSTEALSAAGLELEDLLSDATLSIRCRQAAVRHYGLAQAVEAQMNMYRSLLGPPV